MKAAILTLAILLSGCIPGPDPITDSSIDTPPTKQYRVPGGYANDFRMQDGTRCISYNGLKQGGITCDWQSSSKEAAQ